MRELDQIRQALAQADARGQGAMLVTVLGVDGSVYRGAGARMVVFESGETVGAVSGGCLEADIVARSPEVFAKNQPELFRYDTRASDDVVLGLGLGCQGIIDLLLEPFRDESLKQAISFYAQLAQHRHPVELITVIDPELAGQPLGTRRVVIPSGVEESAFPTLGVARELIRPATQLVICGGGADAIPLARLGRLMGCHVTVVDHRGSFADAARFPEANAVIHANATDDARNLTSKVKLDSDTFAVVMAHSAVHDRTYLHLMLNASAKYIGVLGPRRRTVELLGDRYMGGLPANVHSPIGLDIGAETPDEIALAIIAEIAAVTTGRGGAKLRDRGGPIHDRARGSLHG